MDSQLNFSEAQQPNHASPTPSLISIDTFLNLVKLRTAKVVKVESIPNKDKLYKLTIEVGSETRTLVAGIKPWYLPEDIVGKTIAIVSNLQTKKLGGVESQGMLLAVLDEEENFSLLVAERPVKSGTIIR